ncbi:MAG: ABC transporter ATP-binding protein [Clostridia bacterium]|nr:ABC transporter ATP-binding protein [Clostridia bacterium]MBO7216461.1 ABC transporter ATP-binding protein [Clostridia bacterium]MBO7245860.1 ABC transporter ATP-binding protein [Clostridia bacterium]
MFVIECKGLKKRYGSGKLAIENLDIQLESGRIIGLLGPNGCGKSTFMKLLTGLLVPTAGDITVCGYTRSEATNNFISYLPERTYIGGRKKISTMLDYFEEFYPDFDKAKAYDMLRSLNLDPDSHISSLSKGNREKVQLILVMARNAQIYLLDEPIAGVDPAAREFILRTIVSNLNPGATVLISTHLIQDVEPVLDEYIFVNYGGNIIGRGTAAELMEAEGKTVDAKFREVFRYA